VGIRRGGLEFTKLGFTGGTAVAGSDSQARDGSTKREAGEGRRRRKARGRRRPEEEEVSSCSVEIGFDFEGDLIFEGTGYAEGGLQVQGAEGGPLPVLTHARTHVVFFISCSALPCSLFYFTPSL
jgi:hypothetical protein